MYARLETGSTSRRSFKAVRSWVVASGTFTPSRRQIRSTRSSLTSRLGAAAGRCSEVIRRILCALRLSDQQQEEINVHITKALGLLTLP